MQVPEEQVPVSPSVVPDFYVWSFPGAPVRIHLYLDVVERLAREVRRAYGSIPSHSVEVGGFLLGASDFYSSHVIEVKDFEPFLCEYRADHRFILSEADRSKMEKVLAARRSASGEPLTVLGFYRSHIREGLRLAEDDLSIIKSYFCDPASIFLLMKPTEEALSAGFFFWDSGRIDSEFTFLEFPFEAQQLAAAHTKSPGYAEEAKPDEDTPEPDLAHVGEHLSPAPLPTPVQPGRANWLHWLFYPVFTALVFALGAAGYVSFLKWFSAPTRTIDPDVPALSLRVERQGNDLRVGWKRTAPAIHSAKSAILLIRDGESQRQELTLEPDQLRTGSVVYTPASSSVQFRLEVTGLDGKTATETVLALTSRRTAEVNSASPALPSPVAGPASGASLASPPVMPPPTQSAAAVQKPVATNSLVEAPTIPAPTTAVTAVPATPIRQAQPNVPANLRTMIASEIEVEVKVLIDEAGRVLKAEPVPRRTPVSASLIGAARNAALLWRFEPAKRGGQPVQSEMILKFRFLPAART